MQLDILEYNISVRRDNMYNPMQQRMEQLLNQKQMIEQQMQMLQQFQSQVPPININNQLTPQIGNYDFNGKWVDSEEQARNIANNNLPLILFDNNNPIFYMKQVNGDFKKYSFSEIIDQPKESIENKVNDLEDKLNRLLENLQGKEVSNGESIKR